MHLLFSYCKKEGKKKKNRLKQILPDISKVFTAANVDYLVHRHVKVTATTETGMTTNCNLQTAVKEPWHDTFSVGLPFLIKNTNTWPFLNIHYKFSFSNFQIVFYLTDCELMVTMTLAITKAHVCRDQHFHGKYHSANHSQTGFPASDGGHYVSLGFRTHSAHVHDSAVQQKKKNKK